MSDTVRRNLITAGLTLAFFTVIFILLVLLHPLMYAGNHVLRNEELVSSFTVELGSAILIFIATCAYVNSLVYLSPIQKNRYLQFNPDRKVLRTAHRVLYVLRDSAFWIEALIFFLFL